MVFDLRFAVSASLTIDPKPWQNAGMHKTGALQPVADLQNPI
jgi:hypothetical protein